VGGRLVSHPLPPGASLELALAATVGRLASALQALHQLVARALELGHVGNVPLGAKERVGGLARLPRLRVGGELGLEAGDLAPQLPPAEPLVAVDLRDRVPRHVETEPIGERFDARAPRPAGGVDGARHVAGVDAVRPGAVGSLGREAFEVRGHGGALGDERAEAVTGDDQPVLLEPPVHGPGRVDVDAGAAGELADAGKPVTRAELPARDQHPQPPSELRAEWKVVGSGEIGGELGRR
jgi:hypothetical protein